jgi:hypothetical protein
MKLPNKLYTINESVIGKFPLLLSILSMENQTILSLYNKTYSKFETITDFIDTLEALFFLKKIKLNENSGVLQYVK